MTSRARNGLAVLLWVGLAAGCGGNSSGESGKDSGPDGAQVPSTGGGGAVTSDGAVASGGVTGTGGNTLACSGFTTLAGGYVKSGALHGYAWLSKDTYPATTMSPSDFSALTAGSPLCVSGSVAHSLNWDAWIELGISINQAPGGATSGTYVPASLGININLSNPGGSQLRVMLIGTNGASDPNDNWCAPIVAPGGFIPWSQFNTKCADNSGTPYAGQALQSIAVMVPDNNTTSTPFNFCVHCLAESGAPSGSGGTGGTDGSTSGDTDGGDQGGGGGDAMLAPGPVIELTSASASLTAAYLASGTVTPGPSGSAVTSATVSLNEADPISLTIDQGSFQVNLDLKGGTNVLAITATDEASNSQRDAFPVFYTTGLPSSRDLIDAAAAAGTITAEQALTYRVFAEFKDPRLPAEYQGDDTQGYNGDVISDLIAAVPTLSENAKDTLGPFLAPLFYQAVPASPGPAPAPMPKAAPCNPLHVNTCPVASGWDSVSGANIKVWYMTIMASWDLPKAQAIKSLLEGPTNAAKTLTDLMGHSPLHDDGSYFNGGDNSLDIILGDVADPGLTIPSGLLSQSNTPVFITLRRSSPMDVLMSNAVHEYMHAIQYSTALADSGGPPISYPTLSESSAVWASHYVLGSGDHANHSYHEANPHYLNLTEKGLLSDPKEDKVFKYGAWLFLLYLEHTVSKDIVRELWDATATNNEKDAYINTLKNHKKLEDCWPKFAVSAWNRAPARDLFNWDKIDMGAKPVDNSTPYPLHLPSAGAGTASVTATGALPFLSASYKQLDLTDPSVRSLLFMNGMTFKVGSASALIPNVVSGDPITCPSATKPSDPATVAGARVWAIKEQGGTWATPEDWSTKFENGYSLFCNDVTTNRLQGLVFITSYANTQKPDDPFAPLGDNPTLYYSSAFCDAAKGHGTLSYVNDGVTSQVVASNFTWTYDADITTTTIDPSPTWVVCGRSYSASGGGVTLSSNGVDSSGCTVAVGGSENAPVGSGESPLQALTFATAPVSEAFSFPGFATYPTPVMVQGTMTCPGQSSSTMMVVSSEFWLTTELPTMAIGADGRIVRTGADLDMTGGTGNWTIEPMR